MYHIRLNYDVPQWCYFRRCEAIARYAPDDFRVDLGRWHPCIEKQRWDAALKYDLILNLVPDDHQTLRKHLADRGDTETVLVGGLNVGWGNHKERLRMCQTGMDHIVANNRDVWERLGKPEGMTWISNGVDLDTFRVKVPIENRTPRVLWCGAIFHSLVRPGNTESIKGFPEVIVPLGNRLEAAGIDYDFRVTNSDAPHLCRSTEEMVDWYNTGTIYVCASSSEGTPNPALEAAACGCTIVSTPVGNMPELIRTGNGILADRNVDVLDEMVGIALKYSRRLANQMQRDIQSWHWRERSQQYYELFRRLIDERRDR